MQKKHGTGGHALEGSNKPTSDVGSYFCGGARWWYWDGNKKRGGTSAAKSSGTTKKQWVGSAGLEPVTHRPVHAHNPRNARTKQEREEEERIKQQGSLRQLGRLSAECNGRSSTSATLAGLFNIWNNHLNRQCSVRRRNSSHPKEGNVRMK